MRVALVVLAAGCWKDPPVAAPAAPPPDPPPAIVLRPHPIKSPCEVAIDHVFDVARDELDKVPDFADKLVQIRDAAVGSCIDAQWSADVLRCFDDTIDNATLTQCQTMLTPDQMSDLMRRITEVLTAPAPAP